MVVVVDNMLSFGENSINRKGKFLEFNPDIVEKFLPVE